MIYIRHARICTPYRLIKDCGIFISDGKIKKIIEKGSFHAPGKAEILDAGGNLVCPGFIEVHTQGAGGNDFLDGSKEALIKISQTLARFGTTSFLATTVFKNGTNPHIENIVANRQVRGLLGIHLEGPFVNPDKKGMIRSNGISACSKGLLKRIMKISKGALKMMTIAPELKGAIPIIKELKKEGIIASFGHSDADYQEAREGIDAGISHATHLFNAMRPIHHREPAGLTAILTDDNISVQLISDGVHVHPAVIKLILTLKGVKNIVLITDSMASQGLPDGNYVYDGWKYRSKEGACRYKDGTLIGTSLPLNAIIRRMARFSGVSLLEAIQMATINPARVLGLENKKGSIEEGKDADLAVMDRNLEPIYTIQNGKIVYRK
ncbi:MAG: N-acetylglucosamine-6-phosphate deacetylase [Candidatus Omnitrophica bacterium]|nr:N-acetylglucosamine-6-phosphate deacetylase [Candidatus Omnitrophota bacterium]